MNEESEEIHCILYEGKTAKNEWKNDDFLRALQSVYKQIGQFFFHTSRRLI